MIFKVIVHVDNIENDGDLAVETEIYEHELMLFDFVMNNFLNALKLPLNSKFDYFKYVDEDGELITVQQDEDLNGFVASFADFDNPLHVHLASTRPDTVVQDDNSTEIKMANLENQQEIGRGQFGCVYKSFNSKLNQWVAVKSLEFSMSSLQQEIEILKICASCDKIVKFLGASQENGSIYIFLEFMDGLSLDKYGKIPVNVLGNINVEIVAALTFMWQRNMIHRGLFGFLNELEQLEVIVEILVFTSTFSDVKPSNFLVNSNGQVKLADFGVSRTMLQSRIRTCVGTEAYLAPERINSERYTISSDVWSLGISLTEMTLGQPPTKFIDTNETVEVVSEFVIKNMPKLIKKMEEIGNSVMLKEFIQGCLNPEPTKRTNALGLEEMDFVKLCIPVDLQVISIFVRNFDIWKS